MSMIDRLEAVAARLEALLGHHAASPATTNTLAPVPGAQTLSPSDLGVPSPEPAPMVSLPEGFASGPNEWGEVKLSAVEAARASDPFFASLPQYWGIQDTLTNFALTDQQRYCLVYNMGNARLMLGMIGAPMTDTWRYYSYTAEGNKRGAPFNDALCFPGDQTIKGATSAGVHLADLPGILAGFKASGKVPTPT